MWWNTGFVWVTLEWNSIQWIPTFNQTFGYESSNLVIFGETMTFLQDLLGLYSQNISGYWPVCCLVYVLKFRFVSSFSQSYLRTCHVISGKHELTQCNVKAQGRNPHINLVQLSHNPFAPQLQRVSVAFQLRTQTESSVFRQPLF